MRLSRLRELHLKRREVLSRVSRHSCFERLDGRHTGFGIFELPGRARRQAHAHDYSHSGFFERGYKSSCWRESRRDAVGDSCRCARVLLDIRNLKIRFGATAAVRGISLHVDEGEVLGLVGESGSGKSATSLAILGLLGTAARVEGQILWQSASGRYGFASADEWGRCGGCAGVRLR